MRSKALVILWSLGALNAVVFFGLSVLFPLQHLLGRTSWTIDQIGDLCYYGLLAVVLIVLADSIDSAGHRNEESE